MASYKDCSAEFVAHMEDLKIKADKEAKEVVETFDIYEEDEQTRLYEILSSLERINLISQAHTEHLEAEVNLARGQNDRLMKVICALYPALAPDIQAMLLPLIQVWRETRASA